MAFSLTYGYFYIGSVRCCGAVLEQAVVAALRFITTACSPGLAEGLEAKANSVGKFSMYDTLGCRS